MSAKAVIAQEVRALAKTAGSAAGSMCAPTRAGVIVQNIL